MQHDKQTLRRIWISICCCVLLGIFTIHAGEPITSGKFENIIFPVIEFDDADIFSVIRYINRNSKRYDPDGEGISIVAGFTKKTAEKLPKITMSFSKIPMSEVLRYICQGTGLKYRVEAGVVIIGTDVDNMQTGYFNIRGDAIADAIEINHGTAGRETAKADFANTFDNK